MNMWNDVKLMNGVANALFALALLIVLAAGVRLVLESPAFPLRSIRIEGDLRHVGRRDIVQALDGRLAGNFFNMNLDAVRAMFEDVRWVRHAEVRRLWPDRLEVRLEEQVALARWGQPEDGRLVNVHGEVFNGTTEATLPLFAGPSGSALEVAQHYDAFRRALAPLELAPVAVVLSPRFSWQVRLSNGLTLQLGRDADRGGSGMSERLARFVGIYPGTVAPMARRVDYADLRYGNGFALHVPGVDKSSGAGKAAAPKAAPKLTPKAGHRGATTKTAQGAGKAKTRVEAPAAKAEAPAAKGGAGGATGRAVDSGTRGGTSA